MANLLFECFSEEIPARMQKAAAEQLQQKLEEALKEARLDYSEIESFVSPRHLSVIVQGLPTQQPDQTIERKGPKTSAPDKALEGFLKSVGLTKDQLEVRTAGKDDCYFAVIEEKGKPAAQALKAILETTLQNFHWPKSQRWGAYNIQWVRPLQNLCCVFDGDVIPVTFDHLTANNITYGHRFLAPDAIEITDPLKYVELLEAAYVLVKRGVRKEKIRHDLQSLMDSNNMSLVDDEGLLEEVTGLVEWPIPLMGEFEESFLELPPEVLVSEMRYHQKYFAANKDGKLSNHFITISNMITSDDGKAVIHGNSRVLRARLSDGAFYWDQDRNKPLSDWNASLDGMIFHAALGSVKAKVNRIEALSPLLAVFVPHANLTKVQRAASLCKADLVTGMVGEFPDLQGVMGRYYAIAQKEDAEVADAIRDHYKPIGAQDDTPTQPIGITVSIADKLDSLVGLFAIDEKPTGSKDPFALRRAALGIIRTIVDNELRMPLRIIIDKAIAQYPAKVFKSSKDETAKELFAFFIDRLKVIMKDQGVRHDIIQAVLADESQDDLLLIIAKIEALAKFLGTQEGENLTAAYKRASNILAAEEKKNSTKFDDHPKPSLFELDEEKNLFESLEKIAAPVKDALEAEKYSDAMQEMASLRAAVDAYFDKVMVNVDDADVRINRLNTLHLIRSTMDAVVQFGQLEG
ncbi:MAG: glycine--tRNA ligase subunit beta [Rickettsiales bacterium]|nr:glycine--tRNA ligase subunit beta [Rickettsiales bacterium]